MKDRGLRLDYPSIAPKAVKALVELNDYSDQCAIDQPFRRLVEILVSEMNGCTYCINVHSEQALALGEGKDRVQAVADWRASPLFSLQGKSWLGMGRTGHAPDHQRRTRRGLRTACRRLYPD